MKKFLSLVLALIMTMSLVTIGASAAEYEDFTDKDEIQYAEAVAVLNRLGIITGYTEGDFRPEGELTRGAAAKIIASLLLGPEAANNLAPSSAPFKDVPLDHTFAGPISYCSNLKIINGYSDGSFQPGGTLTGYAFSKMLLGALGYDGDVEGFTGAGWNMNVMRLGGEAHLFDSISFKGNDPVNREEACLLALNTLKATMVEYTGGMNISNGDQSVVVNPTRTYKTSNQEYATHISNRRAGGVNSGTGNANADVHYTVEFGEEHFIDLRMTAERGSYDLFGRPSNEWSYKKVTIGTFPVEPDRTYTTQVIHNVPETTDASKVRALELSGFKVDESTNLTINGKPEDGLAKVADIANYTDNGALVEVYISEESADLITDVVVVQTQLMEVKRVGSDYVALDRCDKDDLVYGYNKDAIDVRVNDVEVDDDYYSMLSGLKAGDLVAVAPVWDDGEYNVGKAYVPETVTGALTRVDTYGTATAGRNAISVTVGGTAYNIAQWNKDLTYIDGDTIRVTNKNVTLYLDEYGNALKSADVGDTSNWMVIQNFRQGLVNGSIVTYANGWDISGEELSLNIGVDKHVGISEGDLVYYSNDVNSNTAEWKLSKDNENGVFDVNGAAPGVGTAAYEIKASNTSIALTNYDSTNMKYVTGNTGRATIDTGIKFIYVDFDEDGEVDNIEFVSGVKDAKNEEIVGENSGAVNKNAQACVSLKDYKDKDGNLVASDVVTDNSAIKAVVIKRESTDASVSNLLYITNYYGSATKYDNDNRPVYGYTAVIMGADGKIADDNAVVYSYRNLKIGQFARYTKVTAPEGVSGINDDFYELRGYGTDAASSTWNRSAAVASTQFIRCLANDKYLVRTSGIYNNTTARDAVTPEVYKPHVELDNLGIGDESAANLLNTRGASWVDLRTNAQRIEDIDDLKDYLADNSGKGVNVTILFNDNPSSSDFRHVYLIVVTGTGAAQSGSTTPEGPTTGDTLTFYIQKVVGTTTATDPVYNAGDPVAFTITESQFTQNQTAPAYQAGYAPAMAYFNPSSLFAGRGFSGWAAALAAETQTFTIKYTPNPFAVDIYNTTDYTKKTVVSQVSANDVKSYGRGVWQPSQASGIGSADAKDVLWFVYNAPATAKYTFEIKDSAGRVMYSETNSDTMDAGNHVFYAQVSKWYSDVFYNSVDRGYPMSTAPLPVGKYTYTITATNDGTSALNPAVLIQSGTFEIKQPDDANLTVKFNGDAFTAAGDSGKKEDTYILPYVADADKALAIKDEDSFGHICVKLEEADFGDGHSAAKPIIGTTIHFLMCTNTSDVLTWDGVEAWRVTATLTNGTDVQPVTFILNDLNGKAYNDRYSVTVKGDIDLTITKVEPIYRIPAIMGVTIDDDGTINVRYNSDITNSNDIGTAVGSTSVPRSTDTTNVNAVKSGDVLKITRNGQTWANGFMVQVIGGKATAGTYPAVLSDDVKIVVGVDTNGKYSVTLVDTWT